MNYNMMPVAYAVMADPFAKSPYNPVNMSRTAAKKSSGHAPSDRILERVREAAADLAQLAITAQGWKFVTERNHAMLYEMNGRALPSTVSTVHTFGAGGGHISDFYLVRAVTTVHANIPAVLAALNATTTEELAPKMKKIFGKHYAQAIVINELSCTTPPPFAPDPDSTTGARKSFSEDDAYSVNWLSLQGPSSSDKFRDFTMVSYQDGFERQDRTLERIGRGAVQDRSLASSHNGLGASHQAGPKLLGVHVFSSVNFKDIPSLPATSHSDRQHFRNSGFVIEATNDPHAFKLSLFLSLLPTKSSLKHARKYQKWLLSLAAVVGNVAGAVRIETPELNLSHLGKTAWKKSDHCYICLKMFRTFRRCHHCRLCGEAVCSTCSGFVKVSTSSSSGSISGSRRGLRNSQSSIDMRSQYEYESSDDDTSSQNHKSKSYANETRGCTVCIQSISQNVSILTRKSSRSSSSFSSNSHSQSIQASAVSISDVRSEDELSISFGDDSEFGSSSSHHVQSQSQSSNQGVQSHTSGGSSSFQSAYYDHRKRSTGALTATSSNEDRDPSVASVLSASSSSHSGLMKPQNGDHHNVMSTPSMSTTSSSFSRTSHEAELLMHSQYSSASSDQYGGGNQQQYQRSYMPSFSSEVSYGNDDLSLDPDILALAGLSLKPSASATNNVRSVAEEDYDDFDASQRSSGGPRRWSGTESVGSNPSAARTPARSLPKEPSATGGSTFHFSVMSNSSNNSSSTATPAAQSKSSVHAEIAALMLEDLAISSSSASSQVNASAGGPYGKPPTSSMRAPVAQHNQQTESRLHMPSSSHSGFGQSAQASTSSMSQQRVFNPSASTGSNGSGNSQFAPSKIISMAALSAGQQQQQQRSQTNDSANDMILLSAPAPRSPEFVFFDDSRRESIFMRPDDGNDMIPLNLLGKF
ncbi:Phosphatidylinositol-4-phosphate 5-kinase [Globisporangium polare]